MEHFDVVICTPGHSMEAEYVKSLMETVNHLNKNEIRCKFVNRYTSRVAAARESTAMDSVYLDAFSTKPFSGMLAYNKMFWIDSDMSWEPLDFMSLYASPLDIISGIYMNEVGVPMFSPLHEHIDPRTLIMENQPQEVMGVGFGFVCIKNGVFENMQRPWFADQFFKCEDASTGKTVYVPYGEDYSWCISARNSGFKVYIDPLTKVTHHKKVPIRP